MELLLFGACVEREITCIRIGAGTSLEQVVSVISDLFVRRCSMLGSRDGLPLPRQAFAQGLEGVRTLAVP